MSDEKVVIEIYRTDRDLLKKLKKDLGIKTTPDLINAIIRMQSNPKQYLWMYRFRQFMKEHRDEIHE